MRGVPAIEDAGDRHHPALVSDAAAPRARARLVGCPRVTPGLTRPGDWVAWHGSYDDADSSLSRRLAVVRRRIGEALDSTQRPGVVGILSLCAGDGRDLLPELAARPWLRTATTLIELDDRLVALARQAASRLDGVEVRRGDAGDLATYADALPVNVLLLAGSSATSRPPTSAPPSLQCPRCLLLVAR